MGGVWADTRGVRAGRGKHWGGHERGVFGCGRCLGGHERRVRAARGPVGGHELRGAGWEAGLGRAGAVWCGGKWAFG